MSIENKYKQVRVSESSYDILRRFSKNSQTTIIDAVDKILEFIMKGEYTYGDLLRTDVKGSFQKKILDRFEDVIKIVRNIELDKIDKIIKSNNRIEKDTTQILSNMVINEELETYTEPSPSEQEISPDSKPVIEGVSKDEYNAIKIAKEKADIRLNKAINIFEILMKSCTNTSSGRKVLLKEEDIVNIENLLNSVRNDNA